jgi:hypothetical protein
MNKENEEIMKNWAVEGTEFSQLKYDDIPDISFYMDQVISYINQKISFLLDDNKEITSSMINNYVKSKLIEHPDRKKYNRDQVASLIIICILKSILPIQDIKNLVNGFDNKKNLFEIYESEQTKALNEACARLRFDSENCDDYLTLALKFAAEANAKRVVAEKILSLSGEKKE